MTKDGIVEPIRKLIGDALLLGLALGTLVGWLQGGGSRRMD